MSVGASPDPGVEGVRAGEDGVSVGVDTVLSGPVTPDGSSEPEAAGDAVAGASVAVGADPDPVVEGVRAGEAGVSVGVDAVLSGPVTPDGSSGPQATSAAVKASARTTLNRVTYLVAGVSIISFPSRSSVAPYIHKFIQAIQRMCYGCQC